MNDKSWPIGIGFIDRYVWEIAWRATLENLLLEEGIIIAAVEMAGILFWGDGTQEVIK